jgi:hypothetical protein
MSIERAGEEQAAHGLNRPTRLVPGGVIVERSHADRDRPGILVRVRREHEEQCGPPRGHVSMTEN